MIKNLYTRLSTPEQNGKKIGLLRVLTAIFGGLIVSYLGMTLLAFVIPRPIEETAVVSIMLNTFAWACVSTWIALSYTKLNALLKFILPTIVFVLALYFVS